MLFAPQFCEETSDGDYIEAVLAHLILKATVSDAEAATKHVIARFLENFVPMNVKRGRLFANALTKVFYAAIKATYGLDLF